MLRPVVRDAVITALIVGPILVAINYGDAILAGGGVPGAKMALTMVVPFLVALVSGLRAALRQKREETIAAPNDSKPARGSETP
ncbi:MAG: hypothetical protein AAFR65_05855 [Pseudomonadota bacterium]